MKFFAFLKILSLTSLICHHYIIVNNITVVVKLSFLKGANKIRFYFRNAELICQFLFQLSSVIILNDFLKSVGSRFWTRLLSISFLLSILFWMASAKETPENEPKLQVIWKLTIIEFVKSTFYEKLNFLKLSEGHFWWYKGFKCNLWFFVW